MSSEEKCWWEYLQAKLVEEVVDEILGTVEDAVVQVLPRDVMEDGPGDGGREVVPHAVEVLVPIDGHLERQEGQHYQVDLKKEKKERREGREN